MAEPAQLIFQFKEVVDLAGVDDGRQTVVRRGHVHRLAAALQVDDREPAVTERHVRVGPHALVVRAPAGHRGGHGLGGGAQLGQIAVVADPACESTHSASVPFLVFSRVNSAVEKSGRANQVRGTQPARSQ
ncbi:hypothetical protein YUWDRAFT_03074 [Streptomyces sp. AmelKG-D3]|nr:hypothetical protein YUWDRAFT_03074 [Streptomyces sp. AmelKG-D3]